MLRKVLKISAICFMAFAAAPASAADMAADAQALVNEAITRYDKVGADQAFKDFADPNGGFIRGELYVVVQDMNAKMVAHATNPKLNGKDLANLKDPDGVLINQETIKVVKASGEGWVDYKWVHPATKKITPKRSFVKGHGDLIFLAGYYK